MIRRFLEQATVLKEKFILFFKAQSNLRKVLIVGFIFTALICVGFITLFLLVWTGALGRLPDKEELSLVENPVATEVYSADSVLLGRYFIQERSSIHDKDIPEHVEQALLATEDIRFYSHHGLDIKSLFRVLFKSILLQRESSGGGSTISQQLAKNLYPRKKYIFFSLAVNKIREVIIARRLEQVYDKKSILTLYLNTIPFGDNTFGIEAAAQRFFSVPTHALREEQAAVLIGMLKATYTYNPRIFPERARQRRNVVLAQMVKYGKLDEKKARSLQALPVTLSYNKITHHSGLAPYFREYIREELLAWCRTHTKSGDEPFNLYTDGLKIYTTIDSRVQRYAEEAVRRQMANLQKKFADHWSTKDPWHRQPEILTDAVKRSDRYKRLQQQGLSDAAIKKVMEAPQLMTVFTWEGEREVKMSPLDSIKHYLRFLNAGLLVMDPRQGAIRAWVGGINHYFFQYDHVRETTKRQVGSTFKPIVYAAALEQGARPCEFISAEKTVYTNVGNLVEWSPENTHDDYGMKYSMEGALAHSVNTVSVKVLEKAGISNVITLAHKMGINSDMPAVPSLALGVADISMMEMVTAYACLVNKGKAVKPFYITAITTNKGEVLQVFKPHRSDDYALSPENTEIMVHMLRRTVDEGTAAGLRSQYGITNDIGGKTGTTQSNADGWFIAIMPRLVIGAWVGADDPRIRFRSTALGQGATTALPVVARLLQQANRDKTLRSITQARFPQLSPAMEDELACDLYKSDTTFLERIFGKPEEDNRRVFNERNPVVKRTVYLKRKKKQNLFQRLFGKKK